ncbi:MAG: LOG family protein [Actinobacteria bacterium]|nr:LOG family protein [Actinomycetota bacterium]
MSTQIAVFGASSTPPGHPDHDAAVRCGALLAGAGFAVATGGYGGLMEAVSQGAAGAGGHVVGVTAPALFPNRPGANPWVAVERPAESLAARIGDMLATSAGCIALPGSIGTMTELLMAWNEAYIDALDGGPAKPVVAVGPVWAEFVEAIGARLATDATLVSCVPDVEAAVDEIVRRLG